MRHCLQSVWSVSGMQGLNMRDELTLKGVLMGGGGIGWRVCTVEGDSREYRQ